MSATHVIDAERMVMGYWWPKCRTCGSFEANTFPEAARAWAESHAARYGTCVSCLRADATTRVGGGAAPTFDVCGGCADAYYAINGPDEDVTE